jgi:4-phosphopantoate---beta-alanine ligase
VTRISPLHPRYRSLLVRARLGRASRAGIVVPEGLLAQGRAEAFDYLLGERSTSSARRAERLAARWLSSARHPVLSVNGNVAALAAPAIARLVRRLPALQVEVNLFHRTPARARRIARHLRAHGVGEVLGERPTVRIPGLPSDRGRVDARGIARADLCLIPLEDGDRALALRRIGKTVIAIDLNPLSRTVQAADLAIVDELERALRAITREVERSVPQTGRFPRPAWVEQLPKAALEKIRSRLARLTSRGPRPTRRRSAPRPLRRTPRRSRRTR